MPRKEAKKERPLRGKRLAKAKEEALQKDFSNLDVKSRNDGETEDFAESGRTSTGILVSEKRARDVKIQGFSLSLYSRPLVEDTILELNYGQRYGLIGQNGCGKSTLLKCIAAREIPLPETTDTYLLKEEAQPSELSALDWVVAQAREELNRLEALSEKVLLEDGPNSETLMDIYESLDALDPTTFESRASKILIGLGFNSKTIHKSTKDMSGGWRMRVALSRALFIKPTLLLLDEPTNHLDLEACVWLEEYLSTYPKILVVISHSQDFLNGVCSNMMVMQQKQLKYWGGNYDTYLSTRREQDTNQMKLYKKQQEEIAHTKAFIASCGTYSNLIRQGKSRQKVLDKMIEAGLLTPPYSDPIFRFKFPECGKIPPPVISFTDVSFSYSGKSEDYLYTNLRFGIDCDSRIALVGPNGAGKSTLLKLIVGEISPCIGTVSCRSGLLLGRYHQHSADQLDFSKTPIDYLTAKYKDKFPSYKLEEWRSKVGSYGIIGDQQLQPIRNLSDGLKTRLVFAEISLLSPHILLLDEPTNHCDMEMIDSLAEAIKGFQGGMVLISHDFRLLTKVAQEIWVVDKSVQRWEGDILSYKQHLKKNMGSH
mmetsp:Transcript_7471/g.10483  ORF Transcript_7471/g.10483 Transcript_7471/m.10483 type:complete len:596 (-) Transcript_7471:236-2023(-)